jgi:hypothetical protein
MLNQSPLLALLRRLEAQNIWRMTYNVLPSQPFSTAAQAEAQGAGRRGGGLCPPGRRRCKAGLVMLAPYF